MHKDADNKNALKHKDADNRRMMIICLALCVVVICLVAYYTSRTQMWNDTIVKLTATLAEVKNGAPGP